VLLSRDELSVALTRVQSGVGALTIEAACSESVGDLRLAVGYRFDDGLSSLVGLERGVPAAPPGSRRPVLRASRGRFETVTLDLRQVRRIDRFLVLAYSASRGTLSWGGTLSVRTAGGAQVDIPLDRAPAPGVLVPLSVYLVDGQLVLRAEGDLVPGALRDACFAYGLDGISWLDAWTPLT
jgi:hypothetical protein